MYMLDSNIIIYAINEKSKKLIKNITSHQPKDICISSITYAELIHGVEKSQFPEKNWLARNLMLTNISILDFNSKAAEEYGDIRASLEKDGKPIGPMDMLIAAHARSTSSTLITNNTKEFKRVKNLKIINWAQ